MIIQKPSINEGEIYITLISMPAAEAYHLILLPGDNSGDSQTQQKGWAALIGGSLPSRYEQNILFKYFKHEFKNAPYWSHERVIGKRNWGWFQDFENGAQNYYINVHKLRARAVRRVPVVCSGMASRDTLQEASNTPVKKSNTLQDLLDKATMTERMACAKVVKQQSFFRHFDASMARDQCYEAILARNKNKK